MVHAGVVRGLKEKGETRNAKIASVNTISVIYSHLLSRFHLWPNNDATESAHVIHQIDR